MTSAASVSIYKSRVSLINNLIRKGIVDLAEVKAIAFDVIATQGESTAWVTVQGGGYTWQLTFGMASDIRLAVAKHFLGLTEE